MDIVPVIAGAALPRNPSEFLAYESGYWLGMNHPIDANTILAQPWQQSEGFGNSIAYYHRIGIEDALRDRPPRVDLESPSIPNADDTMYAAYSAGWQLANLNPAQGNVELHAVDQNSIAGDRILVWRLWGIQDGLSGRLPRFEVPASVQALRSSAPLPVTSTPPRGWPYLELVAELPVIGKIPYDLAVGIRSLPNGGQLTSVLNKSVTFRLIGDGPDDHRDGFRLSGPNGPIARLVQREVAEGILSPDPRAYSLNAWIGTRSKGEIRLLSAETLRQLGLA